MRRLRPSAVVALIAALDALLSSAAADCTCRAQGRQFELGQTACLATPKGARLATCGMVLNNSSWQFSETPCTVSELPDTSRAIYTFPPAASLSAISNKRLKQISAGPRFVTPRHASQMLN